VGFGFDSAIEVTSSVAAVWRLRSDRDEAVRETAEHRTLRIVGACFLTLAAYVGARSAHWAAARTFAARDHHRDALAHRHAAARAGQARIAAELHSDALEAEARQTRTCAYLAAILLLGVGANGAFGWWWADPLAALGMVPFISWEGCQAVRGKTCCNG